MKTLDFPKVLSSFFCDSYVRWKGLFSLAAHQIYRWIFWTGFDWGGVIILANKKRIFKLFELIIKMSLQ
jgi:hypothetical protein